MNSSQEQPNCKVSAGGTLIISPAPDLKKIADVIYPVGSIFITSQKVSICPLETLGYGKWQKISDGRVLQGTADVTKAGSSVEAGLPNITGKTRTEANIWGITGGIVMQGAFYQAEQFGSHIHSLVSGTNSLIGFDASRSNKIYGKSNTVQPPAYLVNIFERIS